MTENLLSVTGAEKFRVIVSLAYHITPAIAGDISDHLTQSQRQCKSAGGTFKTAA